MSAKSLFNAFFQPSANRPPPLLVLFASIGGGMLGAAIGAVAAVLGSFAFLRAAPGPASGFALAIGAMYLTVLGFIVGGVLGSLALTLLPLVRALRVTVVVLACVGYALGALGLVGYIAFQRNIALKGQRADATIRAEKRESDASNAAYLKSAEREIPPLLGILFYPGARIRLQGDTGQGIYPRIELVTSDPYSRVHAYYERIQEANPYLQAVTRKLNHGSPCITRPGDGRALYFGAEPTVHGQTLITLVLASAVGGPERWPTFASPLERTLAEDPAWLPANAVTQNIHSVLGELIYPGSWLHLPLEAKAEAASPYGYEMLASTDSYEQVVAYYQSRTRPLQESATNYLGGVPIGSQGQARLISVKQSEGFTYVILQEGKFPTNNNR